MDTSVDISELPRPALIGIGVGILVLILFLFFLVDRFVYPLLPRQSQAIEKLKPPPGYPDVAPFNTKGWQDSFYKKGKVAGAPPMMPPGPR
jgi:hypothetical protein